MAAQTNLYQLNQLNNLFDGEPDFDYDSLADENEVPRHFCNFEANIPNCDTNNLEYNFYKRNNNETTEFIVHAKSTTGGIAYIGTIDESTFYQTDGCESQNDETEVENRIYEVLMLPLISRRRLSLLNAEDNDAEDISNFESRVQLVSHFGSAKGKRFIKNKLSTINASMDDLEKSEISEMNQSSVETSSFSVFSEDLSLQENENTYLIVNESAALEKHVIDFDHIVPTEILETIDLSKL